MDKPVETPELGELIQRVARQELAGVHTGLPAIIKEYDAAEQKVTVQPVLRFRNVDLDGEYETFLPPPIHQVPVMFPQANGMAITFPIQAGEDWCWLMFSEKSLDEWLTSGENDNTPASIRRFNLNDAVAYVGLRPFADPLEGVPDDVLRIGQAKAANPCRIDFNQDGTLHIGNDNAEVIALFDRLLAALDLATVLTSMGLQNLDAATRTEINLIRVLLDQVKE